MEGQVATATVVMLQRMPKRLVPAGNCVVQGIRKYISANYDKYRAFARDTMIRELRNQSIQVLVVSATPCEAPMLLKMFKDERLDFQGILMPLMTVERVHAADATLADGLSFG